MSKLQSVRIKDEKTLSDFKDLVLTKYGSLYYNLGDELTKAMREHMALVGFKDYPQKISFLPTSTGTQVDESSCTQKFNKRQRQILKGFDEQFVLTTNLSNKVLTDFIKDTLKVTDPRSVKKWIQFLEVQDFIKKGKGDSWDNMISLDTIGELFPDLLVCETNQGG